MRLTEVPEGAVEPGMLRLLSIAGSLEFRSGLLILARFGKEYSNQATWHAALPCVYLAHCTV
jgi:hypothetical protein